MGRSNPKRLDAGAAAVAYVYEQMQIDAEWSVRAARQFTWWGHTLSQRVAATAPILDRGVHVSRLVATTAIVEGVDESPDVARRLSVLNAMGALLSGFVHDRKSGTVSLACTARVYDDPGAPEGNGYSDATTRLFSMAVAAQVSQAHMLAQPLAEMLGGEVATTQHPGSGARTDRDDMLNSLAVFNQHGQAPSRWAGDEMHQAAAALRTGRALVIGDDDGLSAEIPFHDRTALLIMDTREVHPSIGRGLSVRLALPGTRDVDAAVGVAVMLNQLELEDRQFNAFMGGWCVGPRGTVTFVSFYPNILPAGGYAANVAQEALMRARWVSTDVFPDRRPEDERGGFITSIESAFSVPSKRKTRLRSRRTDASRGRG